MAKVRIQFTLADDEGKVQHTSDLNYVGLSKEQVLFVEKHLVNALLGMNEEATAALVTAAK